MEIELEEEVQTASITDELTAAWDAVETEEVDETIQADDALESNALPIEEKPAEKIEAKEETPAIDGEKQPDAPVADGASEKPPVSMSATAREAWKDTPQAVRDEINKREKDYSQGLQRHAESAKRAEAMDRTLAPYQQLFAMNGGADKTMPGLLQTASVLQMGSGPQKAQQVAAIIQQFGVDIQTLDSILVGKAPAPEAQQQDAVQRAVADAIAPYQQHMQQQQYQQTQVQEQAQTEVANEVNTFAANGDNEFYHDVKADMADILDLAANRGREMSLDDAYAQAIQLNPQIRQIVQGRESQSSVNKKRKASSSIHGTLGGEGGSGLPGSMRAAIEDAWADTGRA